ncbi:MFS transporter [Saccharopolyspora sp. NPDC000995]
MAPQSATAETKKSLLRVIIAGFTGTTIEWYDFVAFGTISVLVFDKIFFPAATPLVSLLAALATFAVGFIARPIGGIFFGYLGDRVGRRTVLFVTMMIMGVSTLLIGLLPTYQSIGVAAPVLLVVLRLIQGFSLGGEWGGVATMLIEHAPRHQRAKVGSWAQVGGVFGPMLGTLSVTVVTLSMSHEQLLAGGWRLPFLFSVVLIVVSIYVRRKIEESPSFVQLRLEGKTAKAPVRDSIKSHRKQIFAVFAMASGNTMLFYTCITFSIAFLTKQIGMESNETLIANLAFLGSASISVLAIGPMGDRIGRRPILMGGAIAAMIMAFPLFWLYSTGNMAVILPAAVIMGIIEGGLLYSVQPAYFGELFPTKLRLAGLNLGYQSATLATGATAPILGVLMLDWANGDPWIFCVYLICIQALAVVGTLVAGETLNRDSSEHEIKKSAEVVGME